MERPQIGDMAYLVFDARKRSDVPVMVTEVSASGRQVSVRSVTPAGFGPPQGVYTLRRNGRFALKGDRQWSVTLSFRTTPQ